MDAITTRRIKLASAAGVAETVASALNDLRAEVSVCLKGENFAEVLAAEIESMQDRVRQIADDTTMLAQADDPAIGWGDERHRLAHRGKAPLLESQARAA